MPGLFDLPAPLFEWLNNYLTGLVPVPVAIAVWAVFTGILSMEIYRLISPQQQIGRVKQEANAARDRLVRFDGEIEAAWPVLKSMLGLSFIRIGIVLPATLLAAYPVLAALVWLSSAYGHRFPLPGEQITVETAPPRQARWIDPGQGHQYARIQILRTAEDAALEVPLPVPVTVIHKYAWWNFLIANPAGYLPADTRIDKIDIHLPERQLFTYGPEWLRGWEGIFLPVLFLAALVYKIVRHID